MVSVANVSASTSWRCGTKEGEELHTPRGYADDDDEAMSSVEPSEDGCGDAIDTLPGTRLTTSFGPGIIEDIHEFEDMRYCTVRLNSFGTVSLSQWTVEALLRKDQKLGPQQGLKPSSAPSRTTTTPPTTTSSARYVGIIGTIRMYNPAKGWGFIRCDACEGDVFLHQKHMVGNLPREYIGHFQSHQGGHQVRFDLDIQHKTRPQALNVSVLALQEQETPVFPRDKTIKRQTSHTRRDKVGEEDEDADSLDAELEEPSHAVGSVEPATDVNIADPWAAAAAAAGIFANSSPADAAVRAAGGGSGGIEENGGEMNYFFPLSPNLSAHAQSETAKRKGMLRMRGLPFNVTVNEIGKFFEGYGVRAEDVTLGKRADGSPSGEASVMFARDELAEKARKERHMHHLGHRYIELFNTKLIPLGPNLPEARHSSQGAQMPMAHAAQAEAAGSAECVRAATAAAEQVPLEHQAQAYQHYFQYFQQAYAAAVASQAVQAYAASAASHYQQNQMQKVATAGEASHRPAEQQYQAPLPPGPMSLDAAAAPPSFDFAEAAPQIEASVAAPSASPPAAVPATMAAGQAVEHAGVDYGMGTQGLEQAYAPQAVWQHYNVI